MSVFHDFMGAQPQAPSSGSSSSSSSRGKNGVKIANVVWEIVARPVNTAN